MMHRTVIRLFSGALLATFALACSDDYKGPTDSGGPSLEVSPLFTGILEGSTVQLTATLAAQTVPVTWASNNTAAATVSSTGLVTGVGGGFAAVTATLTSDASKIRSASITVTALPTLTSGVPLTGLSSSVDVLYRILVPAGATSLTVTTSGGTGDADLLVQHQTPPPGDFSSFDCASAGGTNDETCIFTAPASGTWYILISAFVAYSGLTLTGTVTP